MPKSEKTYFKSFVLPIMQNLSRDIKIAAFVLFFISMVGIISHLSVYTLGFHSGQNLLDKMYFTKFDSWILLFFGIMLEEIMYRGFLTLTPRAISGSIAVIIFFFYIIFFGKSNHTIEYTLYIHIFNVLFGVLLSIASGYIIYRFAARSIRYLLLKYYSAVFWISCFAFGLSHISNYPNFSLGATPYYIILVTPQIFLGVLLAVIRLKQGIISSFIVHFIFDACLFLLVVLKDIPNHVFSYIIGSMLFVYFFYGAFKYRKFHELYIDLRSPIGLVPNLDI